MTLPAHITRFWRALDDRFERVETTDWGAVVTDSRFPLIYDANYARLDRPGVVPSADEVAGVLTPAMERAGAPTFHVVSFFPEEATGLLAELSTAGHRLDWDLVMDTGAGTVTTGVPAAPGPGVTVEPLPPGPELWSAVLASFGLFGVEPAQAAGQLLAIERDVLAPAGKRWYGVRDERGELAALASSLTLEGVGYLDNVATFPHARRRGFAGALASHAARRAMAEGASRVWLLAEPGSPAVGLYERLGFAEVGTLASTKSPGRPAGKKDQAPGGGGGGGGGGR